MELHPLCTLFPRLSGCEFEQLRDDIAANGLRQPIVIHDGMILDGGNRYLACIEAGVAPEYAEYSGGNLVAFVLSANLHRRHLSAGQQAAIVASAQDWAQAQPASRPGKGCNVAPFCTVADRAAQSGASVRTQKMADKVAKADPQLAVKVAHGEVSLPQAHRQLSPEKPKIQIRENPAFNEPVDSSDPEPEEREPTPLEMAEWQIDELRYELAAALKVIAELGAEAEANEARSFMAELKRNQDAIAAELRAVKISRDTYMQENAELKRQCGAQRREIDRLKKVAA